MFDFDNEVFKEYLQNDELKGIKRESVFEEDKKERRVFQNTARVQASDFRTVIIDIEAVLKKSTMGNAVAFAIKNNKLEVRCMNKVFYKAILDIEGKCEDCEVVTIFRPIAKTLPDNGTIDVIISPAGVVIKTKISEVTLLNNIASVISVEVENYGFVGFNSNIVASSLKRLLSTTSIINKIGSAVNIDMKGDYMHCKYATVYIECPCDKLNNSITHEIGRVLFTFLNSDGTCFVAQGVNNQIFKKGNRYLALPVSDIPSTSVRELLKDAEDFGEVYHRGISENVKQSVQAFGVGTGRVDFYKEGASVYRESEGCRVRIDCGLLDNFLFSIDANLDFLRDVLNISGDIYKLYKRGDKACLLTTDGCILII